MGRDRRRHYFRRADSVPSRTGKRYVGGEFYCDLVFKPKAGLRGTFVLAHVTCKDCLARWMVQTLKNDARVARPGRDYWCPHCKVYVPKGRCPYCGA